MRFARFLVGILVLLCVSANVQANLIVNGGFENPAISSPGFQSFPSGSLGIPGWAIFSPAPSPAGVDIVTSGFFSPTALAFQGNQFLDLDGSPGPGTISQFFPTTAGQDYALTFAFANNPANPAAQANLTITGSVNLIGPTPFSHSTSTNSNLNWSLYSVNFKANFPTTIVTFQSTSGIGQASGILLDDIQVNAIPEPASVVLWLGAIGVAGFYARRRFAAPQV